MARKTLMKSEELVCQKVRRLKPPRLCPLCGGGLVQAPQTITLVMGHTGRVKLNSFKRKRWGCRRCGVFVVLHRWRRD